MKAETAKVNLLGWGCLNGNFIPGVEVTSQVSRNDPKSATGYQPVSRVIRSLGASDYPNAIIAPKYRLKGDPTLSRMDSYRVDVNATLP